MKVLIAEDDMVSRRVLEATLTKWGYEVVVAGNGDEALAVLQSADAPSLAILDWMMPGKDGVEVCRAVRLLTNAVPTYIILLTAKTEKEDIVAGLEAGADDYLTKPFARPELRARLEVGVRVINLQRKLADRVEELNQALAEREWADSLHRASESRYRHLVEHSQGFICTQDLAGNLLSINPAAARQLEYLPSEMIGRNLSEFLSPAYRNLFGIYLNRIKESKIDSGLLHIVTKSGTERIWQYKNFRYEEAGQEPFILGHAQDITELKQAEVEVRNLSMTDELTGLYNRRGFLVLTEQQQKVFRRAKNSFSLIYADMDGLKMINDTYGHQQGSDAIQQIAQILRESFRESDIIARLGGDEFTIFVSEIVACNMKIPLERLQENLRRYNERNLHPYALAVSIGSICVKPDDESTIEELLIKADEMMYENKKRKKQARVYSSV